MERTHKLDKAERALWQKLQRNPTTEELAEEANLPINHTEEALGAAAVTTSLDKPVGDDNDAKYGDFMTDIEEESPDEAATDNIRQEQIRGLLDYLKPRERAVIEMRYGFIDEPKALEEIGKRLRITRERVRQIENEALKKLHELPEAQAFNEE